MKIVIATPLYPPEIGGPATYAAILEKGLPAKGIEVELVKFSEVRHLPKLIRHYAYYRRVLAAAKRSDLVLALDPVSVGYPAARAARRAKKPLVVKIVGDYAWEQGRQRFGVVEELDTFVRTRQSSRAVRFLQSLETRVAGRAARVIVPSEYLKDVVGAWGVPRERMSVIYNAVMSLHAGEVPPAIAALPKPLVVTASRLVEWKHVGRLIDAVAATPASLAIVGDGPLHNALKKQAAKNLAGRALLVGALSHEATLAALAAADVFVLNSSYEGLSHTLIEALELGAPIIATKVGGNPEVVTDGETGLLIPAGDQGALVHALTMLLSNKPLRTRLSVNAKLAGARFNEGQMLSATAALLAQVLDPTLRSDV